MIIWKKYENIIKFNNFKFFLNDKFVLIGFNLIIFLFMIYIWYIFDRYILKKKEYI